MITVKQAAEQMNVHIVTVRRWIKAGNIKAVRPVGTQRWLIDEDAFENFRIHGVFEKTIKAEGTNNNE